MSTYDPGRRRVLYFAIAIAAVFGVLAAASWWQGRDDPREGSKIVTGSVRIAEIPKAYRAVIRVENRADELVTTTERLWVRRPFQSRVETYAGPPPGRGRPTVRVSVFGGLVSESPRAEPLNVAAPPSIGSGDTRIDAVLDEALDARTLIRREVREVFGRRCRVYRAGGPIFAGDLERYVAGTGNYADVCVDSNGIVLEEHWVYRGRPIQRRVVVELEIDPPIDTSVFRISVEPTPGIERGAVQRVDPDEVDETGLWTLPDAPDGFTSLGRYAVIFPKAAVPSQGGESPPAPSSTTDVYVRGPDLLVVDQDPSLVRLTESEDRPFRTVRIRGLSDAVLIVDARMSEVRGTTPDGSVVRVFGTLQPDRLLALTRSLDVQE